MPWSYLNLGIRHSMYIVRENEILMYLIGRYTFFLMDITLYGWNSESKYYFCFIYGYITEYLAGEMLLDCHFMYVYTLCLSCLEG